MKNDTLNLEGLDLGDLSLEGLEITSIGDARNLPEMGASSVSSSCKSTSCCGSSSCCVEVEIQEQAATVDGTT
jgi:thiazolylpeptide-type bacteriocin precursor